MNLLRDVELKRRNVRDGLDRAPGLAAEQHRKRGDGEHEKQQPGDGCAGHVASFGLD